MDQSIVELNQKLDLLTAQVQYLAEQAHLAERQRQDRAELMRDLTPVVNDVFRITTEQLEEVQEYVDLNDLLRLLKRLLRNGRNFEAMLDQLESFMDLLQTVGPLTDSAFSQAVEQLAIAERKGYFVFAKGGLRIVDNIVLILQTIKSMTQPEIMNFVKNTVAVVEQETQAPVDISYGALLGQMRDPNVRRGLALTMRVLHTIGTQTTEPVTQPA
jgi:negative regulator of replication initiation